MLRSLSFTTAFSLVRNVRSADKIERLLREPRDGGVGLGVAEFGDQLAVDLERLLELAELLLVDAGALHQGARGPPGFADIC